MVTGCLPWSFAGSRCPDQAPVEPPEAALLVLKNRVVFEGAVRILGLGALCLFMLSPAAWADPYKDFNAGLAALMQEKHDAAIAAFTRALAGPGLPQHLVAIAYFDRGYSYSTKKQYALAAADYTAALRAKPDDVDTYVERCGTYANMDRLTDAIADCTSAAQLQPDNWRLRKLRLGLYEQTKQYDAGLSDLNAFIEKRADNPELLLERAELFRQMGQFDKAISDAESAHHEVRNWSLPFNELGWIYLKKHDFAKARDSFDEAVDRSHDPASYLQRGQAEWAMGSYGDAAKSFLESLQRSSQLESYAFVWLAIADTKSGQKVPDDITARFRSADLSQWPGPIVSLYLGKTAPAEVLALKGKDPDTDYGKECVSNFFAAEWQEGSGNIPEAKRLLQQISSACTPDSFTALYASVDSARLPQ